jgi:hypothetical protein
MITMENRYVLCIQSGLESVLFSWKNATSFITFSKTNFKLINKINFALPEGYPCQPLENKTPDINSIQEIMFSKAFIFLLFICAVFTPQSSFSQQTKPLYFEVGASLNGGLYDGDPVLGFGAHFKLLRPFKKGNAFVGGFDLLLVNDPETYGEGGIDNVFMLASLGYRKTIHSFYIEPKIGGGLYGDPGYYAPCVFIGVEPGFQNEKFSYSIDYRFISADGIELGEHFNMVTLKVGYRIGGKKGQ